MAVNGFHPRALNQRAAREARLCREATATCLSIRGLRTPPTIGVVAHQTQPLPATAITGPAVSSMFRPGDTHPAE